MARKPRGVEPGVAYHITQRSNDRRDVFLKSNDFLTYLDLLRRAAADCNVQIFSYCLMSNHVHLVARPDDATGLPALMQRIQSRYSRLFNLAAGRTGNLWQARYYSCPLQATHLWNAVRYGEWNPVRAHICRRPEDYPWSSARTHLGRMQPGHWLDYGFWQMAGGAEGWRELLEFPADELETISLRNCTYSRRPFGDPAFVQTASAHT